MRDKLGMYLRVNTQQHHLYYEYQLQLTIRYDSANWITFEIKLQVHILSLKLN